MKAKIYITICDDKSVFDKFVGIIASKIQNFAQLDYQDVKFNAINSINNKFIYNPNNEKDIKFVNNISSIINKYNDSLFDKLIARIFNRDHPKMHIIVRVDNLVEVNKLKRVIKRPNYKTLYISNTKKLTRKEYGIRYKYKFDSKIQYVDNNVLLSQAKLFISKHIPSLNFIRN